MLFPIDVIIAVIYRTLISENSSPDFSRSIGSTVFWTILISFITLVVIDTASRMLCRNIRRKGLIAAKVRAVVNYADLFFRGVLVLVYIILLENISWPGAIPHRLGLSGSAFFNSILSLFPYLMLFSLSRLSLHRLDEIITPGKWGKFEYMLFKVRTTLFIIIPWLCIWFIYDLAEFGIETVEGMKIVEQGEISATMSSIPLLELVVSLLMLVPVIILFPAILVRIWQCKRLDDSTLKEKLSAMQDKAGVHFDRIYVWQLGGTGFLNGAVVGFIRPFRFLLLSEGLLANLTEEEICGVVGHELGHVKYRHLVWYLFFTTAFISTAAALLERRVFDIHLLAILICVLIASYLRIVFGFISRRFERQADLFGLEIMGRAEPLANSLEKIGFLSGGVRNVKSWHHRSISERVEFLYKAENNPLVRHEHHSHCRRVKLAGALLAIVSIMAFASAAKNDRNKNAGLSVEAKAVLYFKHWQKAGSYFPEDFECRIKLAEASFAVIDRQMGVTAAQIKEWLSEAEVLAEEESQLDRVLLLQKKLKDLEEHENG
ncbi:MAG: M48 family metallopeptidase [Planctomycetota bacterium]|jgi:Zn-dependent protease with chaperone function